MFIYVLKFTDLIDEIVVLPPFCPWMCFTTRGQNTCICMSHRVSFFFHERDIKNVKVKSFDGLLMDFAESENAVVIVRGLRVLSDFEYEFKMALMNRSLDSNINTLFMMPHEKYTHISSSLVKEVTLLGGNVSQYVPKIVQNKLLQKVKNN